MNHVFHGPRILKFETQRIVKPPISDAKQKKLVPRSMWSLLVTVTLEAPPQFHRHLFVGNPKMPRASSVEAGRRNWHPAIGHWFKRWADSQNPTFFGVRRWNSGTVWSWDSFLYEIPYTGWAIIPTCDAPPKVDDLEQMVELLEGVKCIAKMHSISPWRPLYSWWLADGLSPQTVKWDNMAQKFSHHNRSQSTMSILLFSVCRMQFYIYNIV